MVNREMKLAIWDELQTLLHSIVNATKQVAEETRLTPMKKMLTDIEGALMDQRATDARPQPDKYVDTTLYRKQDGQLGMGNKAVRLDVNGKTLAIDDIEYKITPGLEMLIVLKIHYLHNFIVVMIKHINRSLHRPRLNHSRIGQVLLDHILH